MHKIRLTNKVLLVAMLGFLCSCKNSPEKKLVTNQPIQVHEIDLTTLQPAKDIVKRHGKLSVKGNQIVNQHGVPPMLAGPSFFWSNSKWNGKEYYRKNVADYFVHDWNASVLRASIGIEPPGGYLEDPEENIKRAETIIDAAIEQGVYVVLDFHSHEAQLHIEEAKEFFTYFATKYGHTENIIYEIYNEPLRDTDWETQIKPYSVEVIKTIRAIDPDNLIIVGSQSWAQDVDKSAKSPIKGFENLAYSLHFYAGTHKQKLRAKAIKAMNNGLAIMVTEWGSVNANGDGAVDQQSVDEWVSFMQEYKLSHMNWAVSRKDESSAMFKSTASPKGPFSDKHLTDSGRLAKHTVMSWSEKK